VLLYLKSVSLLIILDLSESQREAKKKEPETPVLVWRDPDVLQILEMGDHSI
jgi:hypothetical protein